MPFIWDGANWRWITEGEEYNEKHVVVAKKLFVQQRATETVLNVSFFAPLQTYLENWWSTAHQCINN